MKNNGSKKSSHLPKVPKLMSHRAKQTPYHDTAWTSVLNQNPGFKLELNPLMIRYCWVWMTTTKFITPYISPALYKFSQWSPNYHIKIHIEGTLTFIVWPGHQSCQRQICSLMWSNFENNCGTQTKDVFFSPYNPLWICRKMDRENTAALPLDGMLQPQKGAVKFLLENFPETFLRMNSYPYVKKWVQI